MREYKFRAYCNKNKKFYHTILNKDEYVESTNLVIMIGLINDTLQQGSGKKDRKGIAIYEGDIVKQKYVDSIDFNPELITREQERIGEVYWAVGHCGFAIHWSYGQSDFTLEHPQLEVVGNIYENKELLNVSDNGTDSVSTM